MTGKFQCFKSVICESITPMLRLKTYQILFLSFGLFLQKIRSTKINANEWHRIIITINTPLKQIKTFGGVFLFRIRLNQESTEDETNDGPCNNLMGYVFKILTVFIHEILSSPGRVRQPPF